MKKLIDRLPDWALYILVGITFFLAVASINIFVLLISNLLRELYVFSP